MKQATIDELIDLNTRFYDQVATHFDQTRQHAWPGFEQLLTHVPGDTNAVLDVGCGNGRFGSFMLEHLNTIRLYTGVDISQHLLDQARARLGDDVERLELVKADVIQTTEWARAYQHNYDLVVAFGLLHHVPSAELRVKLLQTLCDCVAEGGILVVTLWNYAPDERFEKKIVTPSDSEVAQVNDTDLEKNDFLLTWNNNPEALRYVHMFDEDEVEALATQMPLTLLATFKEDFSRGGYNWYLVFSR